MIQRKAEKWGVDDDSPIGKTAEEMKATEKMYYIRNEGYLGNALIWWKKDRKGYTCDIRGAHKFTKIEAESIYDLKILLMIVIILIIY